MHQRLDKAEQALNKLAAKSHQDRCILHTKVQSLLKRYRVSDYFLTEINTERVTRDAGPGRPSRKDPKRPLVSTQFLLKFERQLKAIAIAEQLAGWRIYVTNVRIEQLSLAQAVAYYRDQWQVEHGFHRFKRGQLPALPIYLFPTLFRNERKISKSATRLKLIESSRGRLINDN